MPHEPCPHSASVAALLADPLTQFDGSLAAHLPGCPSCRRAASAAVRRWPVGRAPSPSLAEWLCAPDTRETVLSPFQAELLARGRTADLDLGPYLLLRKLGSGGMGEVYLGRHRFLRREDAVKTLRPDIAESASAVKRFLREAESVAKLQHPNVVHVYTADRAAAGYYLAMEFVPGTDLSKFAKAHGPLPIPLACELVAQAADGVQHAFGAGIVHRDLKPGNLLLTWRGEGARPDLLAPGGAALPPSDLLVKVADFGLARALAPDETADGTGSGAVLGTADYMAPEQAADARAADTRADVYSLGCTLYYLLAGSVPFPGGSAFEKLARHAHAAPPPLTEQRDDLPSPLVATVGKCMAKRPGDRFQTPGELATALRPFARPSNQLPIVVRPLDLPDRAEDRTNTWADLPSAAPEPRRGAREQPPNRRGWLLAGAAVLFACLVAGVAWLAGGPARERAKADPTPDRKEPMPKTTERTPPPGTPPIGKEPSGGPAVGPVDGGSVPRANGPAPWALVGTCPSARTDKVRVVGFAPDGSIVAGREGTAGDGSESATWERWARHGEKPLRVQRAPNTANYENAVYAGPEGLVTQNRRRFDPLTLAPLPALGTDLPDFANTTVVVERLCGSGDGKWLVGLACATRGEDKLWFQTRWSAATGKVRTAYPLSTNRDVKAIATDRTGATVAVGTPVGDVITFDDKDRAGEKWSPPGFNGAVDQIRDVAVSPDGRTAYSAHESLNVYAWKAGDPNPVVTLKSDGGVIRLAASPDGRWLAAAGEGLTIWDLKAAPPARYVLDSGLGDRQTIAFNRDGTRLAVGGWAPTHGENSPTEAGAVWVYALKP